MELVLLPRKEFEFKLESGVIIQGKHGTWSTKRLCDKKGWSILEFMVRFGDTEKLTLDDVCQLLLCAAEYKWRKDNKGLFPYSDIDACEWLEEMGGFGSDDWNKLLNHFASDIEEKKKSTGDGELNWNDLQMVCFGAGLSPDEFWDSTIDEVILTYKGKVMDWRVLRNGFCLAVSPYVKEGEDLVSKWPYRLMRKRMK